MDRLSAEESGARQDPGTRDDHDFALATAACQERALVMIVDDDEDFLAALKRAVKGKEFSTVCCSNPQTALELAARRIPDLFLIDLVMPQMDGIELCRRLRGTARFRDAVIMLMTGKVEPVDRSREIVRGLEGGADDYLIKPFGLEEMIARIHAWLRVKSSRDALAAAAQAAKGKWRESEERFQRLLHSLDDVVWASTGDGSELLYVNPSVERVYGRPVADFFESPDLWLEMVHPSDKPIAARSVIEVIEKGHAEAEYRIIRPDGTVRWILNKSRLFRDREGRVVRRGGVVTDITALKQTEESLRKRKEQLIELNERFLLFGSNPPQNIYTIVAACGELLGGSCALYNRLDGGKLSLAGAWNTPPGFKDEDDPEGHICYDVIRRGGDQALVVRNLQESIYAETDPNVTAYNLQTYIGQPVKSGKDCIGALCVVYQEDFEPQEEDLVLMGILASAIGVEEERRKAQEELMDYQKQLQALAAKLSSAEEEERRSLAADLHDHIGQTLAVAKIKLSRARKAARDESVAGLLDEVYELVDRTIQDTRSLAFQISPALLYELGFKEAAEWLVEQIQVQHGLRIELSSGDGVEGLSDDLASFLFRGLRELVMNVVRHAQATSAKVAVERCGMNVRITVEDDGVGFDSSRVSSFTDVSGGFGLLSIRERLRHLGGKLEVESVPGQGTRAIMLAPLGRDEDTMAGR